MTNTSNIKIVDGKLILSLPEAETPVVWQMDLEKAQSASFTVLENKKEKNFALVFKTQEGNADDIATFSKKQSAVDILMETSNALQNAQGQIKSRATTNINDNNKKSDKLGAILAIALVIVLIIIWSISAAGPGRLGQGGVDPQSASFSGSDNNPRQSSGVPVSADDFLTNR